MRRALALACVCIPLLLAACGPSSAPPTPAPAAPSPASGASPVVPPESAAAVDAALADAATHLGVSRDALRVDQVESRDWPDASLGCPQPDQLYSQVVTPGFVVVVASGSHQLEYHTDTRSRVTLCDET